MLELVGKSAVNLELPNHYKILDVLNVLQTVPFHNRNTQIAPPVVHRPDPVPAVEGTEYVVNEIIKHRRRGRGFQFLTLMKGDPTHNAEW